MHNFYETCTTSMERAQLLWNVRNSYETCATSMIYISSQTLQKALNDTIPIYIYKYRVTCGISMAYKPFPKRGLVKMITVKTYHIWGNKRPFTSYDLGYHPGPRALTHQCRVSWGRTLRGSQPWRPLRRGLGD